MKNYKQLICGILIGSLASTVIAFAGELRTFIAEEAGFPVLVDGSPISLDMPVVTIEDRTYLPLRAMGDVLGVDVQWNEQKGQAEVTKNEVPKPTPSVNQLDEVVTSDGVVHYDRIKYETIDGEEYIKPVDADKIVSRKWQDNRFWWLSWGKASGFRSGDSLWCFLKTDAFDREAINISVTVLNDNLYIPRDVFENYVLKAILDNNFKPDLVNTDTVELPHFTPAE